MTQSIGQYRVGINFNPSGDDTVGTIKSKAAELIDLVQTMPTIDSGEAHRLRALAATAFEEGAMWAVKAATKTLNE